jgi:septum formation protein
VVDTVKPFLYLASQSPRRRELLQQIGVSHQVVSANVEEIPLEHETAAEYVLRLAQAKALAGLANIQASGLTMAPVLGADTVVVCDDDILEKPRDQAHALAMLQRLSGRTHQVMTAVALASADKIAVELSVTDVVFRELDDVEISAYWHTGEPQDKAGGYGIQGLGAVFVQQIRGSYTGVVGLPIEQTIILLKEFGLPWWQ